VVATVQFALNNASITGTMLVDRRPAPDSSNATFRRCQPTEKKYMFNTRGTQTLTLTGGLRFDASLPEQEKVEPQPIQVDAERTWAPSPDAQRSTTSASKFLTTAVVRAIIISECVTASMSTCWKLIGVGTG
jgi:hypothetical protein